MYYLLLNYNIYARLIIRLKLSTVILKEKRAPGFFLDLK